MTQTGDNWSDVVLATVMMFATFGAFFLGYYLGRND